MENYIYYLISRVLVASVIKFKYIFTDRLRNGILKKGVSRLWLLFLVKYDNNNNNPMSSTCFKGTLTAVIPGLFASRILIYFFIINMNFKFIFTFFHVIVLRFFAYHRVIFTYLSNSIVAEIIFIARQSPTFYNFFKRFHFVFMSGNCLHCFPWEINFLGQRKNNEKQNKSE